MLLKCNRVVIRIIFIAHRDFDLLQNTKHVIIFKNFIFDMTQNRQNQFVKEFPFVLEEEREESGRHFRIVFWENRSKDAENPIGGVHLWSNLMLFEVFMDLRKVLFDEKTNNIGVLVETR